MSQSLPSVSLYIRITDAKGRRYERVNRRNPQNATGPKVYCLHSYANGRRRWPLRRIEQRDRVRRETAGAYLKAAGIGVRPGGVGTATAGKTGQRGDHRVGRDETGQPQPRKPFYEGKSKSRNGKTGQ